MDCSGELPQSLIRINTKLRRSCSEQVPTEVGNRYRERRFENDRPVAANHPNRNDQGADGQRRNAIDAAPSRHRGSHYLLGGSRSGCFGDIGMIQRDCCDSSGQESFTA